MQKQVGNNPSQNEIIRTLLMLYADQYKVEIIDFKVTDRQSEKCS